MTKKEKGITLIALVVTIVVLLILAGTSIAMLTGENGIIEKAKESKTKTEISNIKEEMEMALSEWTIDYHEKDLELIGRSSTTDSGATVTYGEDGIIYISKNGSSYIGILQDGKIYEIRLYDGENNEEGKGINLTDYEWTAKVPTDNWLAKESYYNLEWEGEGTEESPYLIKTVKDLAGLSYKVATGETYIGKYFKLMKDLNMKNHIWVPIGYHSLDNISEDGRYYVADDTKKFCGKFDGNSFSVSGLYFDNNEDSFGKNIGLFGYIERSQIRNLNIIDSYLKGNFYIGGICGLGSDYEISNCSVDIMLKGYYDIGGIVGRSSSGRLTEVSSLSKFIVEGDKGCIGGIIGDSINSNTIKSSISDVNILSENGGYEYYIGGLFGKMYTSNKSVNNVVFGTISDKKNALIGGVTGMMWQDGYIDNNVVMCNLLGKGIGGIYGRTGNSPSNVNQYINLNNIYVLKNDEINTSLTGMGSLSYYLNAKMVAFWSGINDEKFTYTYSTSELAEYKGNLLNKLNKYVEDNQSENLLSWKIDERTQKITFDK